MSVELRVNLSIIVLTASSGHTALAGAHRSKRQLRNAGVPGLWHYYSNYYSNVLLDKFETNFRMDAG